MRFGGPLAARRPDPIPSRDQDRFGQFRAPLRPKLHKSEEVGDLLSLINEIAVSCPRFQLTHGSMPL